MQASLLHECDGREKRAREESEDTMVNYFLRKYKPNMANFPKTKFRHLLGACKTDLGIPAESKSATVPPTSPVELERRSEKTLPGPNTSSRRFRKPALKSKAPRNSTTVKSVQARQKKGKPANCATSKNIGNLIIPTPRTPTRRQSHVEPESSWKAAKKSDLKDNDSNAPALVTPPGLTKPVCFRLEQKTAPTHTIYHLHSKNGGKRPGRGGRHAVRSVGDVSGTTLLRLPVPLAGGGATGA